MARAHAHREGLRRPACRRIFARMRIPKIPFFLAVAAGSAALAALGLASLAHNDLGMSSHTIRSDALLTALLVFGMLVIGMFSSRLGRGRGGG